MLPQRLVSGLWEQLARSRVLWSADQIAGRGGVAMPDALDRKYPRAGSSWNWFWVFPQDTHSVDPRSGVVRRHHMYDQTFQRAFKRALTLTGIARSCGCGDDHDLYPCFEDWRPRSIQSDGFIA